MWKSLNLQKCLQKIELPKKLKKTNYLEKGNFPVVSQEKSMINGYFNDASYVFQLTKPVVIFGDHTKVIKYVDFDFIMGADGVKILQPIDDIHPKYFFYYIKSKTNNIINYERHFKYLKKIDVIIPPMNVQEIMVKKLEEAFNNIDIQIQKVENKIINCDSLKSSFLRSNLTNYEKSKSWNNKLFSKLAYTAGRIGWKGLTAKEYVKQGPLFLSVHSLNYGMYVKFDEAFHITQERYDESPEIMLKANDLLICKDGAGIGKVGIIEKIPSPSTINSSLLLVRSLGEVLPKYLYYYFISPMFQSIIKKKIDGATTPHLYQRDVKQLSITYPDEINQKKIINKIELIFEKTNKIIGNYKKQLIELSALKSSLLTALLVNNQNE